METSITNIIVFALNVMVCFQVLKVDKLPSLLRIAFTILLIGTYSLFSIFSVESNEPENPAKADEVIQFIHGDYKGTINDEWAFLEIKNTYIGNKINVQLTIDGKTHSYIGEYDSKKGELISFPILEYADVVLHKKNDREHIIIKSKSTNTNTYEFACERKN